MCRVAQLVVTHLGRERERERERGTKRMMESKNCQVSCMCLASYQGLGMIKIISNFG